MRWRILFWCASFLAAPAFGASGGKVGQDKGIWAAVDQLIEEQKMQEALDASLKVLATAEKAGEGEEWTRALVRVTQLRMALSGYETAVAAITAAKKPADLKSKVVLGLFEAHAYLTYLDGYGWEIDQRERVDGAKTLKTMTRKEIFAATLKRYTELWQEREALGKIEVKSWSEFLEPNDYPEKVRPSMRDALAYFAADLLVNTANWTPDEQNELHKLGRKELLAAPGAATKASKIDDAASHPLRRMVAVLADLEAWHQSADERDGALEARLARLRRLRAALSDDRDLGLIVTSLTEHLPAYKDSAWWSEGMATLSDLVRAQGDLPKARALAKEGATKDPTTYGGQRARAIQAEIEAPDYHLEAMSVDAAGKRSVLVRHKNVGKLWFRAWRLDLAQRVAGRNWQLNVESEEDAQIRKRAPDASFAEELPETGDYATHKTFVRPPKAMAKPGLWYVVASAREDFGEAQNRKLGVTMTVSDLVIVSRPERDGSLAVTVLGGEGGAPVFGASVDVFRADWGKPLNLAGSGKTDKAGSVAVKTGKAEHGGYVVFARHDGHATFDASMQYLYKEGEPESTASSFVYTDRAIYRPLQKISWKVIAYGGNRQNGSYAVLPSKSVTMTLHDANHEKIAEKTVKTNAFGTAAGEFTIPTGKLLGQWFLQSSIGGSAAYVKVEEYKRPTFEVTLKDPEAVLRLNQEATVAGEARYYFGLPVSGGTVKWKVARQAVYPWWWGYFGHGSRGGRGRGGRDQGANQTIAFGTSEVSADGAFKVKFTPEADASKGVGAGAKDVSYRYTLSVDLTDGGGETRSASRSFRVGFVSVEAGISVPALVLEDGPIEAAISRASLDGLPRAGKGTWRLLRLAGPDKTMSPAELPFADGETNGGGGGEGDGDESQNATTKRTPGDGQRERWQPNYRPEAELMRWADGAERAKGTVEHGEKGAGGNVKLPALTPGAYRLRYETEDESGAKVSAWKEFVVGGKALPLPLPFYFAAERTSVEPGGIARLVACSGIAKQTMILDRFRDGTLVERRFLKGCEESLLAFPVTEKDRGGFTLSLSAVIDHQWVTASQRIGVPWTNKELAVELTSFRDKLTPGAKETFEVTVKSSEPEKDAAELLAYMYDKSLDAFALHAPPSPLSIYPDLSHARASRASLGQAPVRGIGEDHLAHVPGYSGLRGDTLKLLDGYGVGGLGGYGGGHGRGMMLAEGSPPSGKKGRNMAKSAPAPAMAAPAVGLQSADSARALKDSDEEERSQADGATVEGFEGPGGERPGAGEMPLRENFSETAFFMPQLLTGKDGRATLSFTVPDSVTGWNVWVHAVTKDLRSGSTHRETKSVKDLMVRPYMPRFFREGDAAELKVAVNNAGETELSGEITLEIADAESGESRNAAFGLTEAKRTFKAAKGGGTDVVFALTAPKAVGIYAFKVTARAGALGDGELRPLPVLPSRMRLMQSKFVTLKDKESRILEFPDLAKTDDSTRVDEKLVVTLDAQLFYGVMKALPYLALYPYECTEQTLNRFLSTGIVSSVFAEFPAVAKMAKEMAAKRPSQLEAFSPEGASDPNRVMTMEETPWLNEARGGARADEDLIRVLDPAVAKAQRTAALAKLVKAQNQDGGFPWFPGGRSSEYITLYLMHGFAKAVEFGVDVPKDVVKRSWNWLGQQFRNEYAAKIKQDCCWEWLTFLNYVASAYPDPSWTGNALKPAERELILAHSFKHWKEHSPYLKAYLALTLKRAGRAADAKLVLDSVMDSAKTEKDLGTFWLPEDRSWLWYRDTIETHAFVLRALTEIEPKHPKLDGLVTWLFLNKKMSHWKSTRATAEVIYSLVHYLKQTGALGVKEAAKVAIGTVRKDFTFAPDRYVGRAQLVVEGSDIKPQEMAKIEVAKETKGLMFASATWHYTTDRLPTEGTGDFFTVARAYFKRDAKGGKDASLTPISEKTVLLPGDEVEVQLSLTSKHEAEYVHLRDPRAAGLEPDGQTSGWRWDLGLGVYEETRDSGANFFFERLPPGQYTFKYRVRANMGGRFRVGPATVQSMYAPEFAAFSAGHVLEVKGSAPSGG